MSLYLIPPSSTLESVLEVLNRSKIPLTQLNRLYDILRSAEDHHTSVACIPTKGLQLLGRYATELVDEPPTVVLNAPDVYYDNSWRAHASELPFITWAELEKKLAKSGHTAYSAEDMEKNSRSATESGSLSRHSVDEENDSDVIEASEV